MVRHALALDLMSAWAGLPAPTATLVHLRLNGAFYGTMWIVEAVDDAFVTAHGLVSGAEGFSDGAAAGAPPYALYTADPPTGLEFPGATFGGHADYDKCYEAVGAHQPTDAERLADLAPLIEKLVDCDDSLDDERFVADLAEIFDVDAYLRFLAVVATIQDRDHYRQNYYLFRDRAPGARWTVLPYGPHFFFCFLLG